MAVSINQILQMSLTCSILTLSGCRHQKLENPVTYRPAVATDLVHDYGVVWSRSASEDKFLYCVKAPDSSLHYINFDNEKYIVGDPVPFTKD